MIDRLNEIFKDLLDGGADFFFISTFIYVLRIYFTDNELSPFEFRILPTLVKEYFK